jgi:hypothetical protein
MIILHEISGNAMFRQRTTGKDFAEKAAIIAEARGSDQ